MSKSETLKQQLLLFKKINRLFMEGMEKGKSPHDILFKFIMEKPAVLTAFLKVYLPFIPTFYKHKKTKNHLEYC